MKALQFNVNVPQFVAAKTLRTFFGNKVFYKGRVKTISLVDIPEPTLPPKDWVKIKTIYCGFCGSDMNLILLHDSPSASPFTSFPCVTGHEVVGEIVETGTGVENFKAGDMVTLNPGLGCEARGINPVCPSCQAGKASCENFAEGNLSPGMFSGINKDINGGFAPLMVAHKSQLFKIPDGMPPETAVMTEPVSVALQAVLDNMPEENEKILVIGAGVIGNLVIQSVRALVPGCSISVIEPSSFAADLAKKRGADEMIPFKEAFKQTTRITGAKVYKPMIGMEIAMGGFDRIFDTVAAKSTLNLSMRLLAGMGTLSIVGIGGDVKLDLTPLWLKLQTIKGVYGYGYSELNGKKQHVFEIALDLMQQGKIRAENLVTHKFAIEDYEQMIEVNLNKGQHKALKTVVSFV
ncbi:MAG: alcohol dehydrogenase catalytic domain-containing protein [Desulfobacteraceae bacterium]|nr:alcohol dehydrogenase catalytic domain-containing protein [Desulfobacteraceae bacterium]